MGDVMIETLAIRLNRPPAAARRTSLFRIAAGMFLSASLLVVLWLIDWTMDFRPAYAFFRVRRGKLARSAAPLHGLASGP
jgi:hypothetical protein